MQLLFLSSSSNILLMAFTNKTIRNPKTGQSIVFLQTSADTSGALLKMEATYSPHSAIPAAHYHPNQEEDFLVLSGELTIHIAGQTKILKAGESVHISRNEIHSMWNQADSETVMHWTIYPALQTEYLLETMTGLACDGKTNKDGMPAFLQLVPVAKKYSDELRLAKPPFALQKVLFSIFSPLARICGYKPVYKKYLD